MKTSLVVFIFQLALLVQLQMGKKYVVGDYLVEVEDHDGSLPGNWPKKMDAAQPIQDKGNDYGFTETFSDDDLLSLLI